MRFEALKGSIMSALSLQSHLITHIFDIGWGNEVGSPIVGDLCECAWRIC